MTRGFVSARFKKNVAENPNKVSYIEGINFCNFCKRFYYSEHMFKILRISA